MRKLLLLAWVPFVVFLFPLPPQAGKQLMNEVMSAHETRAGEQPGATGAPTETTKRRTPSEADLDSVVAALWIKWFQNLGLLMLGLLVGVMAWRARRHWQLFPLGMSIFYLTLVISGYLRVEGTVPDGLLFFGTESNFIKIFQLNLRLVEVGISNGSLIRPAWIVYNEILMPIFQIAVLVWILWLYSRRTSPTQ